LDKAVTDSFFLVLAHIGKLFAAVLQGIECCCHALGNIGETRLVLGVRWVAPQDGEHFHVPCLE
jgi:hypothetical protein